MNPNIREILIKRVDQQRQAVGIVAGVVDLSGRRVVARGNLVNADTIFEIGSVTKVFTSLVLADMANRKEVGLDDPAANYLPEHVKMPERGGRSITLLDLSTHRSGLPPMPGNLLAKLAEDPRNPNPGYTVDDLYQFLAGYELSRDPGAAYEYSNLGAGLLGHLLARRAGMDYESLIKSRVTQPLGMVDTGVTPSTSMMQRMAAGHNAALAPVPNSNLPTPLAGAGALRSSANDMLTLLEAFLGYGESPLAPAMGAKRLGWLNYKAEGREIAWHNGATGGFRTFAGFDPAIRVGVIVLANASTPAGVDDIGFHLLNPKLPLANPQPAEPPRQHTEMQIDPALLDRYTGAIR